MSKHASVLAAEAVVEAKKHELGEARAHVERLEREYREALDGVRHAQHQVDATLPQCDMVRTSGIGGDETRRERVVIVRKTPSGMLVVRLVGGLDGEARFKKDSRTGRYLEVTQRTSFISDYWELQGIPASFTN